MDRFMGSSSSSSSSRHHFHHHHHPRPPLMPQQQQQQYLPTSTTTVPSSSPGVATTTTTIPDYDPSQFADPEDDDDIHMSQQQPSTLNHPTNTTTGTTTTTATTTRMMMHIKQEDPGMNDHHHQYHSNNNNHSYPTTPMVPIMGVDPHHHQVGLRLLPPSSSSVPDPVGSNHMDTVTVSSAGTVQTYSSLVSHTTSRSSISSSSSNSYEYHVGSHFHALGAAAVPDDDDDDDHFIHEPNRKRPHCEAPPVTLSLSVPEGTVDIPRVKTEMSLIPTSRILQDDVSRLSSEPSSTPHQPMTTAAAAAMSSIDAPRARLHHWYARPPRHKILANGHYHCWPDSTEQTHIQQWTAILVCPLTGELFRAGPCPSLFAATPITLTHCHNDHSIPADAAANACTTWWFAKKTYAEHGAAARAYDCWTLRSQEDIVDAPMGTEPPHREPIYRLPDLMVIPYEIRQNILRQQAEIRRIGGLPPV